MTRIFLDANVLVAAAASSSGGSALVMEICRKGHFEAIVSRLVLLEAERNIRKKFPSSVLTRYHHLLESTPLHVVPSPTHEESDPYLSLIHEKDAPILAAAIESRSEYLVSLDQHDFITEKLRRARLPLKILTPKDFLRLS